MVVWFQVRAGNVSRLPAFGWSSLALDFAEAEPPDTPSRSIPVASLRCGWLGKQPAEDLAEPGEPHHPNIA